MNKLQSHNAKKYSIFLINFALIFLLALPACKLPKKDNTKKFDVNLNKFDRSLKKVDKTLSLVDSLDSQIEKVNKARDSGKISEGEAQRRINAIDKTLGRQVAKSINKHPASELPAWAKALGLSLPQGLQIDKDFSQITSEDVPGEGFNSVTLVYQGSYLKAMRQASIIAGRARIPLAEEYKTAFEMKQKYGDEIIKGAVYVNFEPGAPQNPRYNIAITVDESGTLTISATDTDKMAKLLQNK